MPPRADLLSLPHKPHHPLSPDNQTPQRATRPPTTPNSYPAATTTHREVSRDGGFELLPGVVVPKGEMVYTSTWCVQRDPEYWPAADEFWPERFLAVRGSVIYGRGVIARACGLCAFVRVS